MLRLHPDKRAKASDLVHHNWLDGVLVQGEIDVIRRAEEDEARRRRREAAGGVGNAGVGGVRGDMSPHSRLAAALDQSEADAMKPVDDIAVMGDTDSSKYMSSPPAHSPSSPPPPAPPQHQQHAHHPPKLSNAPVPTSSGAKENAKTRPTSSGSVTTTPTATAAISDPPRSRPNSSAKSTSASKRQA